MKTRLLISWAMSLVSLIVLATHSFAKEVQPVEAHEISIGEYVVFLNAVAGESDEHGLYDLEVLRKEIVAQEDFFCLGKSNRIFYIAAEGIDPTASLFGLNELQALRYCNWIENGSQKALPKALATTETGSYDLTGNEIIANDGAQHHIVSNDLHPGYVTITTRSSDDEFGMLPEQATDPLMMSGFGEHGKKSGEQRENYDLIGQGDFHHEDEGGGADNRSSTTSRRDLSQGSVTERGSEIDSSQRNPDSLIATNPDQLTLDHFRVALEAHPEAERFVIVTHQNGNCSIEPQADDPTAPGRNRGENIDIIRKLRELISSEVDDNNADHPLRITKGMTTTVDPLSAPRLREILERTSHAEVTEGTTVQNRGKIENQLTTVNPLQELGVLLYDEISKLLVPKPVLDPKRPENNLAWDASTQLSKNLSILSYIQKKEEVDWNHAIKAISSCERIIDESQKPICSARKAWIESKKIEKSAAVDWDKVQSASYEVDIDKAIEKATITQNAFNKVVKEYERIEDSDPEKTEKIDKARNKENIWNAKFMWLKAKKTEDIAATTNDESDTLLWEKFSKEFNDAIMAWDKLEKDYKTRKTNVVPQFKNVLEERAQEAKNQKDFWIKASLLISPSITQTLKEFNYVLSDSCLPKNNDKLNILKKNIDNILTHWKNIIEQFEKIEKEASNQFKPLWHQRVENAKNQEAIWEYRLYWLNFKIEEYSAEIVLKQAQANSDLLDKSIREANKLIEKLNEIIWNCKKYEIFDRFKYVWCQNTKKAQYVIAVWSARSAWLEYKRSQNSNTTINIASRSKIIDNLIKNILVPHTVEKKSELNEQAVLWQSHYREALVEIENKQLLKNLIIERLTAIMRNNILAIKYYLEYGKISSDFAKFNWNKIQDSSDVNAGLLHKSIESFRYIISFWRAKAQDYEKRKNQTPVQLDEWNKIIEETDTQKSYWTDKMRIVELTYLLAKYAEAQAKTFWSKMQYALEDKFVFLNKAIKTANNIYSPWKQVLEICNKNISKQNKDLDAFLEKKVGSSNLFEYTIFNEVQKKQAIWQILIATLKQKVNAEIIHHEPLNNADKLNEAIEAVNTVILALDKLQKLFDKYNVKEQDIISIINNVKQEREYWMAKKEENIQVQRKWEEDYDSILKQLEYSVECCKNSIKANNDRKSKEAHSWFEKALATREIVLKYIVENKQTPSLKVEYKIAKAQKDLQQEKNIADVEAEGSKSYVNSFKQFVTNVTKKTSETASTKEPGMSERLDLIKEIEELNTNILGLVEIIKKEKADLLEKRMKQEAKIATWNNFSHTETESTQKIQVAMNTINKYFLAVNDALIKAAAAATACDWSYSDSWYQIVRRMTNTDSEYNLAPLLESTARLMASQVVNTARHFKQDANDAINDITSALNLFYTAAKKSATADSMDGDLNNHWVIALKNFDLALDRWNDIKPNHSSWKDSWKVCDEKFSVAIEKYNDCAKAYCRRRDANGDQRTAANNDAKQFDASAKEYQKQVNEAQSTVKVQLTKIKEAMERFSDQVF